MHEAELIIKHATGQVVRRRNRSIVDSFKECDDFHKAARKMIHWIVSPQFKSRYMAYQESVSKGMKWHPFKVVLGNDTRVAGTNIMYQGLLRSIWALEYFHNSPSSPHDFKSLFLSSSQWDQLSQYESIIRSTQILAIKLQTDYPAAIAISSLYVGLAFHRLKKAVQNGFSVVETRKGVLSQNEYPWDPKSPFDKLPTCLRLYSNSPNNHGSGNYLTKESCHLVDRFLKELPNYFSKQETDRDLATMCHPLSAVMGVSILVEMNFGQDLDYYKALLIENLFQFHKREPDPSLAPQDNPNPADIPIELEQVTDALEISNSDDDDDDDDIWEQVNKKQKLEQEDKLRHYKNTSNCILDSHAQVKKRIVEEIISYLSHVATLDWAKLIHNFPSKLHIDFSKRSLPDAKTKKEWDLSIKKCKVTKVWKHFDVLKWWGTDARHKFNLLFPLATIVLGKPYTNAYQERCFSLASWFDSKLMQCQKAETLQMRCLDAQNRKNVSRMTQLMGSKWEDQPLFKEQKAHTIISYIDQQRELQSIIALDDSTHSDDESCLSVAADITKEMEEIVDNGNSTDETDEIEVTEIMLNSLVDGS